MCLFDIALHLLAVLDFLFKLDGFIAQFRGAVAHLGFESFLQVAIEEPFKNLKGDLLLRPIFFFHRKEERIETQNASVI